MDDVLLYGLISRAKKPDDFAVVGKYLSVEPYAIMMRRDEPQFEKIVNRALNELFQSGEIRRIYARWFNTKDLTVPLNQYLKEAYGPRWGFLFGWAAFLVVMSGGIASLAVAFGEYLGSFVPFFSTTNVLLAVGGWRMSGGQVAAALAIAGLTAINYVGVKEGAGLQNVVTVAKVGALLAIALLGFLMPAPVPPLDWEARA